MSIRERSLTVLIVATLVVSLVASGGALADTLDPTFKAYVSDPVVEPGSELTFTVTLVNDPEDHEDRARTAVNVRAEMKSGRTPIDVKSGTKLLGEMPNEVPTTVQFRLDVPQNIEPGIYRLPIELTYEFDNDEETVTVPVRVRVEDRARFAVASAQTSASIGDSGTVEFVLENTGSEVAKNATVVVSSSDAEFSFGTGAPSAESFVGRLAPDEQRRVTVKARVGADAIRRNYSITATVNYLDADGERQSESVVFGVQPRPQQSFEVVEVASGAPIGGSGTLVLEIRNEGPDTVYDSTVTVASTDADVGFASDTRESESYTGRWETGEVKQVTYRINVAEQAVQRNYSIRATLRYEDADGRDRTPKTLLAAVRPLPEQTFDVQAVDSSLRAGRRGEIDVEVANTGVSAVTDVVVAMQFEGANLTPRAPERPVGDLEPGESAPVSFTVDVPKGTSTGTYRVSFDVRYETPDDDVRQRDRIAADVDVAEWQPAFTVTPINATFPVDSSGKLELSITNNRDDDVSELTAIVSPTEPITSDDPSTFVSSLDSGESARTTFHLDVSDDAIPKTHLVTVELTYTDEDGLTQTAGPYRVPVTVEKQPGPGFPVLPVVAIVAAIVVGAAWWWFRRS
jgi:hypothetical protein